MKRVLTMGNGFTFAKDLCMFEGHAVNTENGIFYTDPYFTKIVDKTDNGGRNSVMQFIKDGFQPFHITDRQIRLKDFWSGHHTYGVSHFVNPRNIDGAMKREEN